MYLRDVHAEKDIRVLHQLIRDNPLGLLTTAIDSDTYPFLQSSHIPFVIDIEDETSETELGRLRGHIARQNPQSKAMIESLTSKPAEDNVLERDVLVMFNSPHHHYVTPKFYVETKPTTGKVVPTWNYAAVQAYGKAKIYFDTKSDETSNFLQSQMEALSHNSETREMGYTGGDTLTEWKVSDAPDRYVALLKKSVIGIEIRLEKLEGKFKMSQEMSKGDREGVIRGFERLPSDRAQELAKTVRERGEAQDAKLK
ncbi:Fc.00g083070.m01.CDS01 [Cosmosporella sp. VM-42]